VRGKGYSLAALFGLDNVCGRYDEGAIIKMKILRLMA